MKLIHDFYQIEPAGGEEAAGEYTLALNKSHFIYRVHFQGNPVTPGVCIILLCKELMELRFGKSFFLKSLSNVKFLSVIDPRVTDRIQVSFPKIVAVDDGYKCSALVYRQSETFAKLSFYLQFAGNESPM
ncbi:MAG: hypothetical protein LBH61_06250 [Dysgonamonadaceae bacterium]|jgi:3-hydroxyacyl-[acyl-carrier-protein] dehydratase|nr:hypothetical protein [Dysgonamonadaceae bacterium]